MTDITIELEADPVPIVKIIAAGFRREAAKPAFRAAVRDMKGTFALKAFDAPTAVTIAVKGNTIHVSRGIHKAAVTFVLDFDSQDIKSIRGAFRHPMLVYRASRLLKTRAPAWTDAAKRFWEAAASLPGMPSGLHVHCRSDGTVLDLGEAPFEAEIEGHTGDLVSLFNGGAILVDSTIKGKISAACTMKHLAVLSEATKLNLLGDL